MGIPDEIRTKGIVLSVSPQGESDRRLIFLSSDFGKITVFANGARRPKSHLAAASRAFTMGDYTVRQGRTAYSLISADIAETFDGLSVDMDKFCYASYMCELAGYYTHENVNARDELNLLYVSFKYLLTENADPVYAKAAFELRIQAMEGESYFAYVKDRGKYPESILNILHFIDTAPLTKLYGLIPSDEEKREIIGIADSSIRKNTDRKFKSLEILDTLY